MITYVDVSKRNPSLETCTLIAEYRTTGCQSILISGVLTDWRSDDLVEADRLASLDSEEVDRTEVAETTADRRAVVADKQAHA